MTARTTGVKQGLEKNVYHVKTLRTWYCRPIVSNRESIDRQNNYDVASAFGSAHVHALHY